MKKARSSETIQTPKGLNDILPAEFQAREKLIEKAKNIAEYYGFRPIQTPHLEKLELFTASLGETSDIVEKQMYTLKTRGGDKLVLRPEGSAPLVRAYFQHGMQTKPQPIMLYYYGSFFRHERPQKGRRRELQQFGLEILGTNNSIADALIIKLTQIILEEMGLKPIVVHLNSIGDQNCRKIFKKELLAYYRKYSKSLCRNCRRRLKENPLRLLDCKEEKCGEIKEGAPQIINFLCQECTNQLKEVLEILDNSEVAYYLNNHLVRGLDYYYRTVFEFFLDSPDESQLAIAGGGRYNSLGKFLTGKELPAVGSAIGIDRVLEILKSKGKLPALKKKTAKVFFVQLGTEARHKSLEILEKLRKAKIPTKHSLSKSSLKSQLKIASKLKVQIALILGQKEALENTIIIRHMDSNAQETIPIAKMIDYLKKVL